jgi:hypothetical protein
VHILRCTGVAPDGLRFELGLRSDGPPLAVYRSGEVRVVENGLLLMPDAVYARRRERVPSRAEDSRCSTCSCAAEP